MVFFPASAKSINPGWAVRLIIPVISSRMNKTEGIFLESFCLFIVVWLLIGLGLIVEWKFNNQAN
jgi:hypothetical protein